MDNLIAYMNANYADKYFLKYSTPSEYVKAVNNLGHTWPTKTDDMFPYQSGHIEFWTGFYTTRATAKEEVRKGSSAMHASNKFYSDSIIDSKVTQDKNLT